MDKVAEEIESYLTADNPKEAYKRLQGWYKQRSGRPPKPTYKDEEATRKEYENLFGAEEPPGEDIPIHISPMPDINDEPPTEQEIIRALKKLKLGRAPGASGIRVEHLRTWMSGATRAKDQIYVGEWAMITKLIQMAFIGEDIPSAFFVGILVLLPKPDGDFRGIALLEVIYKLISSIINQRLAKGLNTKLHDAIHGFRSGRGTGTATIEAKLLMQLAQRANKPLHMIFMDLKKAYDTLDRDRTMKILQGYGVGENIRRIIGEIWNGDTMVTKQSGFFGKPFRATRGVRQGDIMSPFIFNIICDAVIRAWEAQMNNDGARVRRETRTQFYADDGLLSGEDPQEVQHALDTFTNLFARVGLKMNAVKTKVMSMTGCKAYTTISREAYLRRITGEGFTNRERNLQKVECNLCGAEINRQHLIKHQMTRKCMKGRDNWIAPMTDIMEEPGNSTEMETTPTEHRFRMPARQDTPCPVRDCQYVTDRRESMRRHFRARHTEDTIIIEEEGALPQCDNCGLFTRAVGEKHKLTEDCKKATKSRQAHLDEKVQQSARQHIFTVSGIPLERVSQFKYLGRLLDEDDKDGPALQANLEKARQKWCRIGRILSREQATPRIMATFYKAIIQAVLLYGSESWVVTKSMMQKLRSFHQKCARHITGRNIRLDPSTGEWIYPDSETTLREAGFWTIEEYIERRKETVMKYARERAIYRRCVSSRPVALSSRKGVWWELSDNNNYLADDA
jgi:hypothetical protein